MADHITVPSMPGAGSRRADAAWEPLREPLFRSLWIAAVISYTGTWMQNVGAGWLMTQLSTSPLMVSLVQAAAAIPVFLVVLPAGALADMMDRRRLLLFTQGWMVVAAAALGLLTLFHAVDPWVLLAFTFLLGLGAVMNDPAWQAITPEVVSPARHASAVALNSAGFNVARAVGPALGGLVWRLRDRVGRFCSMRRRSSESFFFCTSGSGRCMSRLLQAECSTRLRKGSVMCAERRRYGRF